MPLMLISMADNINSVQKIKRFILQQIVDEYTGFSNNLYPCIYILKK